MQLLMLLGFTQSAVMRINKMDRTHQVVFKIIGHYTKDVHFHHIGILVNLSKVIEIPRKAMETIKGYIKNVYQQWLIYYKDNQRGNITDKH
jgi:hypothetical protein